MDRPHLPRLRWRCVPRPGAFRPQGHRHGWAKTKSRFARLIRMEKLLLLLGLLLAASSTIGGGLDALAVEGRELHASLRTPRLDPSWELAPGVVPPKNPHLSSDDKFVQAIARNSSQRGLGREGIRSALYARYVTGEKEVWIYGLEAESDAAADRREEALRAIWAYNVRRDLARVHRKGSVLVVVWHTGVSSECWDAVNAGIADRLVAP